MELIQFKDDTNENVLQVQVTPQIAQKCRKDATYSKALYNQIVSKKLDGVTSIKITPIQNEVSNSSFLNVNVTKEDGRKYWTQNEIKELLKIYHNYKLNSHSTNLDKQKWVKISLALQKRNIKKSPDRCREKWKNLLRSYKIAENSQFKTKFLYVQEISSILCNDAPSKYKIDLTFSDDDIEDEFKENNSDRITVIQNDKNDTFWTAEETLILIEMYKKYKSKFNEKSRKKVWEIISSKLHQEGIEKDADKCENKWKNLVRIYRRNKSDNTHSNFNFFNKMKEILPDDSNYLDLNSPIMMRNEIDELESEEDMEGFEEIIIETNTDENYSWQKDEMAALIKSYRQHNIPNWELISEDLSLENSEKSPEECEKMWETLIEEYSLHKDGEMSTKFPFLKEMNEIFEKNEQIKHHSLCKCFEKRAKDKERRHAERMEILKRKLDIEDRKVSAFEKYVKHLIESNIKSNNKTTCT